MQASEFRHQLIRDLAWVMAAPGLLDRQGFWHGRTVGDDWCQRQYADQLDWLSALDEDPDEVARQLSGSAWPDSGRFRLGHYVEQLLAIWLRRLAGDSAVRCALPVKDGRRTVGEIDLLWCDPRGPLLHHWEVTWKLHLRAPDRYGKGLGVWYGLHPNDRLQDKLHKLFREQLRIVEHQAGKRALHQAFGEQASERVESRALVKGQLFYPLDDLHETPPGNLSPDHLRGAWLYQRQADHGLPQASKATRWVLLPRRHWLSPAVRDRHEAVLARRQLLQQLQQIPDIPQVAADLRPGTDGRWVERERYVIVPDDWQPGQWRSRKAWSGP